MPQGEVQIQQAPEKIPSPRTNLQLNICLFCCFPFQQIELMCYDTFWTTATAAWRGVMSSYGSWKGKANSTISKTTILHYHYAWNKKLVRVKNLSSQQLPKNYPETENIRPMVIRQVLNDLQIVSSETDATSLTLPVAQSSSTEWRWRINMTPPKELIKPNTPINYLLCFTESNLEIKETW